MSKSKYKDYFWKNFYTFRRLFAANEKFRGELNYLTFKWHTKDFNQWAIGGKITWLTVTIPGDKMRELNDLETNFLRSLSKYPKKNIEFVTDIKNFLKKFQLQSGWFITVSHFVITRILLPPVDYMGISTKISLESMIRLGEFEKFTEAHYYPDTDETLANFYKDENVERYLTVLSQIRYLYEGFSRSKKSINKWDNTIKEIFQKRREIDYCDKLPNKNIPKLVFSLTDEEAIRKLHGDNLNERELKRQLATMLQARKRLKALP